MYHQCLKAIWKGKGPINAPEFWFSTRRSLLLRGSFLFWARCGWRYCPNRPRGVPLQAWEDLAEPQSRPDKLASTLVVLLDPQNSRRLTRRRDLFRRKTYLRRSNWRIFRWPISYADLLVGSFSKVWAPKVWMFAGEELRLQVAEIAHLEDHSKDEGMESKLNRPRGRRNRGLPHFLER